MRPYLNTALFFAFALVLTASPGHAATNAARSNLPGAPSLEQIHGAITQAYRDELGREPDAGGLNTYAQHMLSGGKDAAWLRAVLRSSPEGWNYRQRKREAKRPLVVIALAIALALACTLAAGFTAKRSALPLRPLILLLLAGGLFWVLNAALLNRGLETGVPRHFPISEVFMSDLRGGLYMIAFGLLVAAGLAYGSRFNPFVCFIFCITVTLTGNMLQGSFGSAFYDPLIRNGMQYYQDALRITDGSRFLAQFNELQAGLSVHAKTHPPFAVLIHWLFVCLGRNHLPIMAVCFTVASCAATIPAWYLFKELGDDRVQASRLTVLFGLLPAVNIYSAVSLDGLIAAGSAVFVLGVARFLKHGFSLPNLALLAAGLFAVNILSFGGTFHVAFAGLLALWQGLGRKKWSLLIGLVVTAALGLVAGAVLRGATGYNHLAAFRLASHLENPEGFRGFAEPLRYAMTRIEGIAEVLTFASVGVAALIWAKPGIRLHRPYILNTSDAIALAGAAVFGLMLAAGAYRTGETARACLFLYPLLLVRLVQARRECIGLAIVLAGIQTGVMQWIADYYW